MRKRMQAPDLLQALLRAPGPSGHEEAPSRIWREAASSFAEVTSDTLGTSFARVGSGAKDAATLALVGHIDEIGVTVTSIEENGLLAFTTLGGISPETLTAQRIEFLTRDGGRVQGAIARKRLSPEERREGPKVELADLHIEIGAKSREEAERLVRVGDAAVWNGAPVELPNGRLMSRSLDNRLGAYVVLEAARRLAEAKDAVFDVVAVAATQEEIGSTGARAAAYGLDPALAIAVDITPATDVPGGDPRRAGRVELGMGAIITRGPTLNKLVVEHLVATAEAEGIPHGFEVTTRGTQTDADEFHIARAGVPTGLVSVPMRYLHTPNELCELDDVESTIRLIVASVRRLAADQSFVR
jgi:putative aminopeptidase FrvX